MRRHTVRWRLQILVGLVLASAVVLGLNEVLNRLLVRAHQDVRRIVQARGEFSELTVEEIHVLNQIADPTPIREKFRRVRDNCKVCHDSSRNQTIQERLNLFEELLSTAHRTHQQVHSVTDALTELDQSVRYIHEHHLAYMKNLLRRGVYRQDYDLQQLDFQRSDSRSASEMDIIGAAVDIHNALLDLFKSFRSFQEDPSTTTLRDDFLRRSNAFFTAVNTFEDYSLDAQDGLLVEELLLSGRSFEVVFNDLIALEARRSQLAQQLSAHRNQTLDTLEDIRQRLEHRTSTLTNRIRAVQFVALALTCTFLSAALLFGGQLLRQVRRTVEETRHIQRDLDYRIGEFANTPEEFKEVFSTLNAMATQIRAQLQDLHTAQDVLERRVEERTRDLTQANRQLATEVKERQQAEIALRESEQRYRDLFDGATDLILTVSADTYRLQYLNPACADALGLEGKTASGLDWFTIVESSFRENWKNAFDDALHDLPPQKFESILRSSRHKRVRVEGTLTCRRKNGKAISFQGIFRDVTQQRRMEQDLLRSQKLESLGVLAGGIAHDFNNLLSAVLGNLSLALESMDHDEKPTQRLLEAEKALNRATHLTQQLLTFARGGQPIRGLGYVGTVIEDSAPFVLRGSNVSCELRIPDDLWPVSFDEGQIGQVINNLVLNAKQAMPNGGRVIISAENLTHSGTSAPPPAGDYVRIQVQDTGPGISPSIEGKIFDPYFTTKNTGNGLGLATAYSIISNHKGYLLLVPEASNGARFDIYLPRAHGEVSVAEEDAEYSPRTDGGRVLVMDDEEMLLDVAQHILSAAGHQVVCSRDGEEALVLYRNAMNEGHPFDLVVLDLTVPGGMGGRDLIAALLELDPDVHAVVSSGYANDPIMAEYARYGFKGVVPKPYRSQELTRVVAILIDQRWNTTDARALSGG